MLVGYTDCQVRCNGLEFRYLELYLDPGSFLELSIIEIGNVINDLELM
jgi:hypothetical protein